MEAQRVTHEETQQTDPEGQMEGSLDAKYQRKRMNASKRKVKESDMEDSGHDGRLPPSGDPSVVLNISSCLNLNEDANADGGLRSATSVSSYDTVRKPLKTFWILTADEDLVVFLSELTKWIRIETTSGLR
ncbi:hypothetical protein RHMOL_Rhmol01G0014800 [Rhododendron molle]|uniref:Uncharacterized protein n=1 Tax=Rhododendron molle TaxID=49168 RepID=A0ACC0PXI6_RHOML|nr:hypothetical protein RHMOL_Rhmol01G0014800 [Rhododendron molle]